MPFPQFYNNNKNQEARDTREEMEIMEFVRWFIMSVTENLLNNFCDL